MGSNTTTCGSRKNITVLAAACLIALTSCSTVGERPFSLPAETIAAQIGPLESTGLEPRIFLADAIEEVALSELAPYFGKHFAFAEPANETKCAREATRRLIESRPDAILVVPDRPEMTGVSTSYFANPFAPGIVMVASANYRTSFVGYAMRAMRARLPFTYHTVTGIVTDIPDKAAAPDLLEGDVLTKIDGADALPPKSWPTWPFYARMLEHSPGDEIQLEWVRAGTGKMTGKARLAAPRSPHRAARDSIDTEWMPPIEQIDLDGRAAWRWTRSRWESDEEGWVRENRRRAIRQ
jgi:hypothetical protein